uniref:MADF domain-containing protein n=2 Tax=Clastoptera arizonana TaxID=38151 RepID=A0A1B6C497_9HEMI
MNHDESASGAVDVDKLLILVQINPAIFNSSMKEYYNIDVINKIWTDIGKELNVPGYICKNKWINLRNSYVRYLRDLKKMPTGVVSKKKKWHLADAMQFLMPWTGPCRKLTGNPDKFYDPDTASPYTQETIIAGDLMMEVNDEDDVNDEESGDVNNYTPKKKQLKLPADHVTNRMTKYLKTITNKNELQEGEDEFLSFFKSLIPDAVMLSARKKRNFKTSVMTKLHQLLDEQEDEQASNNTDISSCVASPSSDKSNTQDIEWDQSNEHDTKKPIINYNL